MRFDTVGWMSRDAEAEQGKAGGLRRIDQPGLGPWDEPRPLLLSQQRALGLRAGGGNGHGGEYRQRLGCRSSLRWEDLGRQRLRRERWLVERKRVEHSGLRSPEWNYRRDFVRAGRRRGQFLPDATPDTEDAAPGLLTDERVPFLFASAAPISLDAALQLPSWLAGKLRAADPWAGV